MTGVERGCGFLSIAPVTPGEEALISQSQAEREALKTHLFFCTFCAALNMLQSWTIPVGGIRLCTQQAASYPRVCPLGAQGFITVWGEGGGGAHRIQVTQIGCAKSPRGQGTKVTELSSLGKHKPRRCISFSPGCLACLWNRVGRDLQRPASPGQLSAFK